MLAGTDRSREPLRRRLNELGICAALGLRCLRLRPEFAEVELAVPPGWRHAEQVIPGVFLLGLVDVAASFALHTVVPHSDLHVTTELSTHFMRPVATPTAHAHGQVMRLG